MTDEIEQAPETAGDAPRMRTIKSFVMRAGRMTDGQQRGLDLGWPKFGLQLEDGLRLRPGVRPPSAAHLRDRLRHGHSTAGDGGERSRAGLHRRRGAQARASAPCCHGALAQGLTNIRVYSCDALEVLRQCVADASLDRVLLFFPDPWHKAAHHKRRIVQPAFAELVRAEAQGRWRAAHGHRLAALCRAHARGDERGARLPQPGGGRRLRAAPAGAPGDQVRASRRAPRPRACGTSSSSAS